MIYFLIIVSIFILYQRISNIIDLIRPSEEVENELNTKLESLKDMRSQLDPFIDTDKVLYKVSFMTATFIHVLYITFYIISAYYIRQPWFTLLAIIQILLTFRSYIREMPNVATVLCDKYIHNKKYIYTIFNAILEGSYIGYLLYFIIGNWR